ncbi:MAG: hypothetical protein HQL56_13165, partial [Magnetococcales bacterium]|nr:hypothetical protein [Magnetococcales bacterium]
MEEDGLHESQWSPAGERGYPGRREVPEGHNPDREEILREEKRQAALRRRRKRGLMRLGMGVIAVGILLGAVRLLTHKDEAGKVVPPVVETAGKGEEPARLQMQDKIIKEAGPLRPDAVRPESILTPPAERSGAPTLPAVVEAGSGKPAHVAEPREEPAPKGVPDAAMAQAMLPPPFPPAAEGKPAVNKPGAKEAAK